MNHMCGMNPMLSNELFCISGGNDMPVRDRIGRMNIVTRPAMYTKNKGVITFRDSAGVCWEACKNNPACIYQNKRPERDERWAKESAPDATGMKATMRCNGWHQRLSPLLLRQH